MIKIYRTVWENPTPEQEIASLDYVSRGTPSAPFLISITAEKK